MIEPFPSEVDRVSAVHDQIRDVEIAATLVADHVLPRRDTPVPEKFAEGMDAERADGEKVLYVQAARKQQMVKQVFVDGVAVYEGVDRILDKHREVEGIRTRNSELRIELVTHPCRVVRTDRTVHSGQNGREGHYTHEVGSLSMCCAHSELRKNRSSLHYI